MKRSTIILWAVFAFFVCPLFIISGHAEVLNSGNDDSKSPVVITPGFTVALDPTINLKDRGIKAGLLYDADNKKIVWQKEMNTALPIASLTKMMVALLAIEDIHAGKVKWDDIVHWSRECIWKVNGKNKTVYTQMTYSVRDLFKAAMIASNNECAEALARYLEGGDLQAALDRMNLRARELGMNNTWYGNPTGLPSPSKKTDNYSTPENLLILALEMVKHNDIMEVTGMGYADVNNGTSVDILRNHNHLTIDYSGDVDGMKTGYTRRAGFCLVATSKKCNHRLISIALGAGSPGVRNDIVAEMMNKYYSSVGEEQLAQNPTTAISTTVYTGKEEEETESGKIMYLTKIVRTLCTVNKGETLNDIATKYNCDPTDIKKWNRIRSATVKPGRKLIVYTAEKVQADPQAQGAASQAQVTAAKVVTLPAANPAPKKFPPPSIQPEPKYEVYVVQPGDTLATIAQRYDGVTVQKIRAINRISNTRTLRIGTKLKVPVNT